MELQGILISASSTFVFLLRGPACPSNCACAQADRDKREAAERAVRDEREAAEAAARQLADEQAAASAKEANLKQTLQNKQQVSVMLARHAWLWWTAV